MVFLVSRTYLEHVPYFLLLHFITTLQRYPVTQDASTYGALVDNESLVVVKGRHAPVTSEGGLHMLPEDVFPER